MSERQMTDKPKVLVVEDDPNTMELLRLRLELLNCEMLPAADAETALRVAAEEQPLLALVDIRLGDDETAGIRVLSQLKAQPETAHILIIVHSILVSRAQELPEEVRGHCAVLPKPLRHLQLAEILATLLAPPTAAEMGADAPA
jgi:CheY-like chemotaxis protein